MNGFTNTILSLLLSWLKAFINDLWRLLSGEDGGLLYRFLADNWLTILIVLCAGGLVVDVVVYFFRWRPYYVWQTKLRHMRSHAVQDEPVPDEQPQPMPAYPQDDAPFAPYPVSYPVSGPQPAASTQVYAPAVEPTRHYAPAAQHPPAYAPYMPPQDLEPVFDDDARWADETLPEAEGDWQNPAPDMPASFGVARPEPIHYLRDMQAGYAPQLPPEQLYAPAPRPDSVVPQVHPGLADEAFRQNFGLNEPSAWDEPWTDEPEPTLQQPAPVVQPRTFHPFTEVDNTTPEKSTHPFARLARRARDLVGMEGEDARTIRDLQSTVDVSTAFHAPVYPQNYEEGED